MQIQVNNQLIEIKNNRTVITVLNEVRNFKHVLNFNFNDYPKHDAEIQKKNFAEYWWLSTLYNDFVKYKSGVQLILNF